MSGYVMKPTNHSPRKPRKTYREKREKPLALAPQPVIIPPFHSRIQDAWPLTMCAELPLNILHWYEPVN